MATESRGFPSLLCPPCITFTPELETHLAETCNTNHRHRHLLQGEVSDEHKQIYERLLADHEGSPDRLLGEIVSWLHNKNETTQTTTCTKSLPLQSDPRVHTFFDAINDMLHEEWDRASSKLNSRRPSIAGSVEESSGDSMEVLGSALSQLGNSMEGRFTELRTIQKMTQAINEGMLLNDVLEHVWMHFREIIPYNRIGFSLIDGESVTAVWAKSDSTTLHIGKGFSMLLAETSLPSVIDSKRPRVLNDLEAYYQENPQSDSTRRILLEGGRSSLTCPLISNGKPIGFMFFTRSTYSGTHVELFIHLAGQLAIIVEKSRLYEGLLQEQQRSEALLSNILPPRIAQHLKRAPSGIGPTIAEAYDDVSILFCDMTNFTIMSCSIPPESLVDYLNRVYSTFDRLAGRLGVLKVKTIGDAYMCACGVPEYDENHVCAIADMALQMMQVFPTVAPPHNVDSHRIALRIGIHCGPVVAGVIGKKAFSWDMWGTTVNTASRMESTSLPGRIQVTNNVRERLGSRYVCEGRGIVAIKGIGDVCTAFLVDKVA